MSMQTYEELLAAQTELAHFNPNHDKLGRFAKRLGGSNAVSKMKISDTDSSATKKVKKDYNELTDDDFFRKYQVSKKTYAKRVQKHGDPARKASSKVKAINELETHRLKKSIAALNKDIDSFKGHENGIFDKNGRMMLSKDDVNASVNALKKQRDKQIEKLKQYESNNELRWTTNVSKTSSLDPKKKKMLKTAGNAINAQRSLDSMGFGDKLVTSQVVKAGAKKAGKMAVGAALATIGGHMMKDYITNGDSNKKKSGV